MKHEATTLMTKKALASSLKKIMEKSPWERFLYEKLLKTAA